MTTRPLQSSSRWSIVLLINVVPVMKTALHRSNSHSAAQSGRTSRTCFARFRSNMRSSLACSAMCRAKGAMLPTIPTTSSLFMPSNSIGSISCSGALRDSRAFTVARPKEDKIGSAVNNPRASSKAEDPASGADQL